MVYGLDQLPDQYDSMGTALTTKLTGGNQLVYDGVTLPGTLQIAGQALRPFPVLQRRPKLIRLSRNIEFQRARGEGAKALWRGGPDRRSLHLVEVYYRYRQLPRQPGFGRRRRYQDYTNRRAERSLYSSDVPHCAVINYILNLPFGKGQRFAANSNAVVSGAISGWSLSGITTFQSGVPLHLTTSGNSLSKQFGAGTIRPNHTAGCPKNVGGSAYARVTTSTWFNTNCFTSPKSPGEIGRRYGLVLRLRQ